MKKVLGKILTIILSLISFGTFLLAISTFASYYIDALGYAYHSNKVVRDAYVFIAIALLLSVLVITLITVAIRSKKRHTAIIANSMLAANILLSFFAFFIGFGMIFSNGTNGCSYTNNIINYGKGENGSFRISYFPEEITDEMAVVQYSYYYKPIDTHHYDIYLEVKFADAETMDEYLLKAKNGFKDYGYIEYQNPYNSAYTDIVENTWVVHSNSDGSFASRIQFKGTDEFKYVDMIYHSISYSYEELTVIYNYTQIGNDIKFGNNPDAGEYYPKYLERFGVQYDSKNDFEYKYSRD